MRKKVLFITIATLPLSANVKDQWVMLPGKMLTGLRRNILLPRF